MAKGRGAARSSARPHWNCKDVQVWRKSIYRRDNWCCQWPGCGLGTKTFPFRRIEAHHIEPWRIRRDLFYDLNNGITLCKKHHKAITGDEERWASQLVGVLKGRGMLWDESKQVRWKRVTERLMARVTSRSRRSARTVARRSRARSRRTAR